MTPEMILTMVVLAFAVWLFISEWVRVDVVGIIMMVMLPLLGLISPREAFVGLCHQEKTRERIVHMLTTGKPLRN